MVGDVVDVRMDALFWDKKVNLARLLAYGFVLRDDTYVYSTCLLDGQFLMTVTVGSEGGVAASVLDPAWGEEYVLHRVADAGGEFVGRIREEYQTVLQSVADECFDKNIFKGEYSRAVIEYVCETYRSELEYLWQRFPNNAVWRRPDNGKWFGALLVLAGRKLGLDSDEPVEIIDLRVRESELPLLLDGRRYFPGYHMNKRHWLTICLDGSVPVEEICDRIDQSYQIAAKK